MASNSDPTDKLRRQARVSTAFTPGAPIDNVSLFGGRMDQLMDVVNTLNQKGKHAILYGERGVGKTSLANILADVFAGIDDRARLLSVGVNCHTGDTFASIWENVFREISERGRGLQSELLTPRAPEDVRFALQQLDARTLIVIDELDRLEDDEALSLMADTIKSLSDRAVDSTIVLVGVADSVEQLLGDHLSVGRALNQVQMPRMTIAELEEIVDKGLGKIDLAVDPVARRSIARLSEGLPFYTHSLALHAGQHAIADDRERINEVDVTRAVSVTVNKTEHSIRMAYERATRSNRPGTLFEEVLLACALAPKGPLGHFTAGAVREPMSGVMGVSVDIAKYNRHLGAFSEEPRGHALERTGEERRYFYRFSDPLLQPFVLLRGLEKGLVSADAVERFQRSRDSDISVPEKLF